MKCRACWSDFASLARLPSWKALLARCLLLEPIRCGHCFHLFFVPFWTIRKNGPVIRIDSLDAHSLEHKPHVDFAHPQRLDERPRRAA